eukprot:gnl/TRDRNA2_/TRDRNA2_188501_c0_seq1.p1 gnl/TRDRNA2_/TRDRNA2_188501_c0~~gnl/TRDRNA2_/TRDRNA2_188501_c0_seq1.p1  ORF type:complete len:185 (+),score=13.44 gnl/TRDRNA2_/TRDRNA2_188501_c0_seq1:109-663(+)
MGDAKERDPLVEKLPSRRWSQIPMAAQIDAVERLSWPCRLLGVVLGFFTMVCIWESLTYAVSSMFVHVEHQVFAWLALVIVSSICLVASAFWVRKSKSSILASFALALSSLLLAIGAWDLLASVIALLVPQPKVRFVIWCVGAFVFLILAFVYTMMTEHNALLDIISCALSLGLNDPEEDMIRA